MRRALCVGIDGYESQPALHGCVNDAQRMFDVLSKHYDGSPNFGPKLLVAPAGAANNLITKAILKQHLHQLFKDEADVALFFFAGHGAANDLGGYLVTQEAKEYDEGVSLQDVLRLANASKVHEIVIVLDSCFSGDMGNVDNSKASLQKGISILTARGD